MTQCPACRKLVAVGMICLCIFSPLVSAAPGHDDALEDIIVQEQQPRVAVADTSSRSAPPFTPIDVANPIAPPFPISLRTWLQGPSLPLLNSVEQGRSIV